MELLNTFLIKTLQENTRKFVPTLLDFKILMRKNLQFDVYIIWEHNNQTIYTRFLIETVDDLSIELIKTHISLDKSASDIIFKENKIVSLFISDQLLSKYYYLNNQYITCLPSIFSNIYNDTLLQFFDCDKKAVLFYNEMMSLNVLKLYQENFDNYFTLKNA